VLSNCSNHGGKTNYATSRTTQLALFPNAPRAAPLRFDGFLGKRSKRLVVVIAAELPELALGVLAGIGRCDRQHQRIGAVGRWNSSCAGFLLRFDPDAALRIHLIDVHASSGGQFRRQDTFQTRRIVICARTARIPACVRFHVAPTMLSANSGG
jgi:hypothetical protein